MKIFLSRTASKELLKIPYKIRIRIESRIEQLARDPVSVKSQKLFGRKGYRVRVGDYRVIYTVDGRKRRVVILSVLHRKDAYKRN